jgi:hypothetical protein
VTMMPVDHWDRRLWRRPGRRLDQRGGAEEHGDYERGDQLASTPKRQHMLIVDGHVTHADNFTSAA